METPPSREPLKGHVSWRWVDAQLNASRSIWIASTRPDGTPHAMPVWYVWDDSGAVPRVYFITARSTQKARNLARTPSVVLHLGLADDVVAVHGKAVIVEDAAEIDRLDAAYRDKYVDPGSGAHASVRDNPLDQVYRVDVVRLLAWVYGNVGTWTEWRFKQNQ
jgi:PPOX class probable F420-dependent enzyme